MVLVMDNQELCAVEVEKFEGEYLGKFGGECPVFVCQRMFGEICGNLKWIIELLKCCRMFFLCMWYLQMCLNDSGGRSNKVGNCNVMNVMFVADGWQ